jgi:hypothetical protein
MELLNAPLIFINNLKNEKLKERCNARPNFPNKFHAVGRTDGRRTHKKFHFFKFFAIRMLAGAHSL